MNDINEEDKQTFINLSLFMALTKPLIRKGLLEKQDIVSELQSTADDIPAFANEIKDIIKRINDIT